MADSPELSNAPINETAPLDVRPAVHIQEPSNPWTVATVILIVALVGFIFVGPFIGLLIAYFMYSGQPMDFLTDVSQPIGKDHMWSPLMVVQGLSTFIGLGIVPALFWPTLRRTKLKAVLGDQQFNWTHAALALGIVVFFSGLNSVFIEWNSNIDLPDGAFEQSAREMEDRASGLIKWLTNFSGTGQYLVGVLVIAILPAVGEELVFRGMIQPEVHRATGNAHAGIWISAILFSALHLQFYGFFPRVFLGALFGYLYLWSGNLMVPVVAHFVNNALAVTAIYLGLSDLPGMELDDPKAMPWYAVLGTTMIFGGLLYRFYKLRKNSASPDDVRA